MATKRHGFGLGSVMIVFIAGIAFYLAWSNYESQAGIAQQSLITDKDTLTKSNIEELKRLAVPSLAFASKDASLEIAENGGTLAGETIWFCGPSRNPVNQNELLHAFSSRTLTNFNKYLDDSTEMAEQLDVGVVPYTCAAIESQSPDQCPQDNYPEECDGWDITSTGGYIYDSDSEEAHRHVQDITARADEDRFIWMYNRLKEAELDTPFLAEVEAEYNGNLNCEPGDPDCCVMQANLTAAFDNVVSGNPQFESHFDEYVECIEEIECIETHSIKVKITCTDKKYLIPGDDETGEKYLTWVIKEMITLGCQYEECVVVGPTGGSSSGGGAPGLPSVSMDRSSMRHPIDGEVLSFQSANYCTDHMKCFDQDKCSRDSDEDLCFTP